MHWLKLPGRCKLSRLRSPLELKEGVQLVFTPGTEVRSLLFEVDWKLQGVHLVFTLGTEGKSLLFQVNRKL